MNMRRYIDTAVDFACRGKRYIAREIALACGLEETRPSKWSRHPEFRLALAEALTNLHPHLRAGARASLYNMAQAGNLAAFDRIREVEREEAGLLRSAAGDDSQVVGGVHVHVHGIPERQPMSTLPPQLTLPAASAAVPSSPAK